MSWIISVAAVIAVIVILLASWFRVILIYDGSIKIYYRFLFFLYRSSYAKKKRIRLRDYTVKALRKKRNLFKKKQKKKAVRPIEKKPAPDRHIIKDLDYLVRIFERIILVIIKKFNRSVRVDIKRLTITVATGDAAQTAIAYGAVSQAVSHLIKLLGQYYKINYTRGAQTGVTADFNEEKWNADIHIIIRIRLLHIVSIVMRALSEYSKF